MQMNCLMKLLQRMTGALCLPWVAYVIKAVQQSSCIQSLESVSK
jgi:hypothetical protein